ncbi:hypothetical protein B0J14DRAFT_644835 [Halenospora varia]|nr:hypothetical protein B0J14DRAFT_644835 [Halenospora varia]
MASQCMLRLTLSWLRLLRLLKPCLPPAQVKAAATRVQTIKRNQRKKKRAESDLSVLPRAQLTEMAYRHVKTLALAEWRIGTLSCGRTPALQKRLQELLVNITRREFLKVQAQIGQ